MGDASLTALVVGLACGRLLDSHVGRGLNNEIHVEEGDKSRGLQQCDVGGLSIGGLGQERKSGHSRNGATS
jgi:hypothetical protein